MKSLVEYIEEQMLLEYAGVFNGADEIAEDIFKLLVYSIQHNKTYFTYNKYDHEIYVECYTKESNNKNFDCAGLSNFSYENGKIIFGISLTFVSKNNILTELAKSSNKHLTKRKIIHEFTHCLHRSSMFNKVINNDNNKNIYQLVISSIFSHQTKQIYVDKEIAKIFYYLDNSEKNAYLSEIEEILRANYSTNLKSFSLKTNFSNLIKDISNIEPFNIYFSIQDTYNEIKKSNKYSKLYNDIKKLLILKKCSKQLTLEDAKEYANEHYNEIIDKDIDKFINVTCNKFINKFKTNLAKIITKLDNEN